MAESKQNIQGVIIEGSKAVNAIQEINYLDIIYRFIFKRWYLYAASVVLCVGLAYFYLKTVEPGYEVLASIVILEDKESGYTEDIIRRSRDLYAASQNVYNEIQQLTSNQLMNEVVEDLKLYIGYRKEFGFAKEEGYLDFPVVIDTFFQSPPERGLDFGFEIHPEDYNRFALYQDEKLVGTYLFDSIFTNQFGTFRFKINGKLPINTDTTLLVYFSNPQEIAEMYRDNLEAGFTDKNSTTIELRLEDAIPQRGIDILTSLMDNYNDIKKEENSETALQTLGFIDERLADVSSQLRRVESNLERYKLQNEIAAESTSDL
ncbi:MAG: Wzz/FepE/Etk N-terminal domain-containing protein, partial [Bacteroidota bacterium]